MKCSTKLTNGWEWTESRRPERLHVVYKKSRRFTFCLSIGPVYLRCRRLCRCFSKQFTAHQLYRSIAIRVWFYGWRLRVFSFDDGKSRVSETKWFKCLYKLYFLCSLAILVPAGVFYKKCLVYYNSKYSVLTHSSKLQNFKFVIIIS